jgi:hypothetical protein
MLKWRVLLVIGYVFVGISILSMLRQIQNSDILHLAIIVLLSNYIFRL